MHYVKNAISGKDEDLTPKFKSLCESIVAEANKAIKVADNDCPYPAESQMLKVLQLIREAAQVVHTVADFYMYAVPDTPWKEGQIRDAWAKARQKGESK